MSSALDRCSTSAAAPTFACLLAQRGIDVTGVDPARAKFSTCCSKAGAAPVRWLNGDATSLPASQVDAAFMTANVAQVFLTDVDWAATLRAAGGPAPGGVLVFETRIRPAGEQWTPELTRTNVDVPGSASLSPGRRSPRCRSTPSRSGP